MTESHIENLARYFAKLPGLGPRSARRLILYLLTDGKNMMEPLLKELKQLSETIRVCELCQNIDTESPCHVCTNVKRDKSLLCVIENVVDLWALERGNIYRGQYFVLGGTLSAIDGRGPEKLGIDKLVKRIKEGEVKEVILATNATLEGQTTAHYIADRLANAAPEITVSRVAHGIPIGGELDYLDEGTLGTAINARKRVG